MCVCVCVCVREREREREREIFIIQNVDKAFVFHSVLAKCLTYMDLHFLLICSGTNRQTNKQKTPNKPTTPKQTKNPKQKKTTTTKHMKYEYCPPPSPL